MVGVSTLPQLLLAGLVGEIGGRGDEDGDGDGELDILLNSSNCWDSLAERAAKSTLPFTSLPDSGCQPPAGILASCSGVTTVTSKASTSIRTTRLKRE